MTLPLVQLATIVTLIAVLVARRGVAPAAERSAVAARLRTLYGLVALLLFLRVLDHWLEFSLLTAAVMATAAWLPLAGLRLVEELQRRHAPRFLKLCVLGGGIGFTIIAISVGLVWSTTWLVALAVFQALATLAMIALLVTARADLGAAERRTAETFLLALVITIPLAISDFEVLMPGLPVRGGAFAGLVLVLATSRLLRNDGSPLWLLTDIAVCLAGAALGVIAALVVPAGAIPAVDIWTAGTAGFLIAALALLVERFSAIRATGESLIGALARAPLDSDPEALLRSHPLLNSARVVDAALLADYPADAIAALLRHRVIGEDTADAQARDAARDLLAATAATHLLRLSVEPPRFLAVSAGGLSGAAVHDELTVAAMLIARPS